MNGAMETSIEKTSSRGTSGSSDPHGDDLAEIIGAYNEVTAKLQRSHEALQDEVVRLQRELASADAQLQRSKQLAALGEMAAGIAHEIRNPLAAIRLYADLVVDDVTPLIDQVRWRRTATTTRDHARKIGDAVQGLDAIVHDVLNVARELKPRLRDVPVSRLIERALQVQRPSIEAAGIRTQVTAEQLVVRADADLIHQAMLNLIRNAVQAMSEDRDRPEPGRLGLWARAEPGHVVISVSDSGPGIDQTAVDRIFNPFFTTRSTGTGLGLAIVHRIVDAHGGTISVSNDPVTGGAVFQLRLVAAGAVAADATEATLQETAA